MKNTFKKGVSRVLIFFDTAEKVWYGVALDFNLIVDGNEPETVRKDLRNLMLDYIDSAKKLGDEKLLNRKIDSEYEKIWKELEKGNLEKKLLSPYRFYSASKEYV